MWNVASVVEQDFDSRGVDYVEADDCSAEVVARVDTELVVDEHLPQRLGQPLAPRTLGLDVGVLPERRQSVDFLAVLVSSDTGGLSVADVLLGLDLCDSRLREVERPLLLDEVAHSDFDSTVDDVALLSESLEDAVGDFLLSQVEVGGDLILVLTRERTARLVEDYVDWRREQRSCWAEHRTEATAVGSDTWAIHRDSLADTRHDALTADSRVGLGWGRSVVVGGSHRGARQPSLYSLGHGLC